MLASQTNFRVRISCCLGEVPESTTVPNRVGEVGLETEAAISITVECPGYGKTYAIDETYAGRRLACKQSGQAIRVTALGAAPRVSATMRVACENCGREYTGSSQFAGKQTVCAQCGTKFWIPTGGVTSRVQSEEARRPSKPALAPEIEPPTPAPLDVSGLARDPLPSRSGGGPSAEPLVPNGSASADSAPLPPRLKPFQPRAEAQKKKAVARVAGEIPRGGATPPRRGQTYLLITTD
jgi:ribosomal protein S27E